MHGLINRSVECFIIDTYGPRTWRDIASRAGAGVASFESLLSYPDPITCRLVETACEVLDKPREILLEDIGTYLVSSPRRETVRRLLRFGGENFTEFLYSLEDLPARARLALPDLMLPEFEAVEINPSEMRVRCRAPIIGFGHVLVGVIRAMADEYGALVLLEYEGNHNGEEHVMVRLLDASFSEGRNFVLAGPAQQPQEGANEG